MGPASPPVTLAAGTAAPMLDPHLLVLGVLVAGWVLDRVFAAVEWLRGSDREGSGERPASRVEGGGSAGEAGRPSGTE